MVRYIVRPKKDLHGKHLKRWYRSFTGTFNLPDDWHRRPAIVYAWNGTRGWVVGYRP